MIRPVDFLDHPLAGDPVEHRQEQGILPDKRLHGPDRTLHSHKFDGKDDEICRHCLRRGAVCKSAFLPVAAHARLAVSFHTRFVRDKKYMLISELLCQMISVHDTERALSDDPDRPDLHSLKLPSPAAVAVSTVTVGG